MLILGIHKDESNNTIGNYIVEGTKPSTKDKVINVETQYYENPGHHDLKDGNKLTKITNHAKKFF